MDFSMFFLILMLAVLFFTLIVSFIIIPLVELRTTRKTQKILQSNLQLRILLEQTKKAYNQHHKELSRLANLKIEIVALSDSTNFMPSWQKASIDMEIDWLKQLYQEGVEIEQELYQKYQATQNALTLWWETNYPKIKEKDRLMWWEGELYNG